MKLLRQRDGISVPWSMKKESEKVEFREAYEFHDRKNKRYGLIPKKRNEKARQIRTT